MINRTILTGRLTKDPELKYSQSGIAVCRFTLAVNRAFSNQQGEREADFIQITAWRKQAENVANYLQKGSLVGIDGRIQTGSFEGQDGKRVFTTDVVAESVQFLEPRSQNQSNQTNNQPNSSYGQSPPPQQYGQQQYNQPAEDPFSGEGPINVSDDDLPF